MLPISLEWARYEGGCRIENAGRYGKVVVSNGGDLVPSQPIKDNDLLYAEFAGLRTAEHVLAFVNRHGFLVSTTPYGAAAFNPETEQFLDDGYSGERIADHLASADLIRRVLRAENQAGFRSRKKAYAELEDIYDQEDLGQIRLVAKPDRSGFQTVFIASSLMNAIWLQLGRRIGGGIEWGECPYCGGWFEKGPGTKKRADADFCSPAHKVASHRKQRGD